MFEPSIATILGPSKAQLANDAADRVKNSMHGLNCRAKELYSLYQEYGIKYQGMDSTKRRLLAMTGPTTDNQVRQVVYAKFLLAAVMEWAPSNYYFSIQAFLEAGEPVFKTDATNELCPIWVGFFDDLQEVVVLLEKIMAAPQLGYDTELLVRISNLLQGAEMKAGWVDSLMKTVEHSTSTPGFAMPTSDFEIYNLWNQFCLNIGNGMSVTDATLRFYERSDTFHKYPRPTPLTEATSQRIYFAFDLPDDEKPWLTHAQAILQQPHHLVPPPVFNNEYAYEPHAWMLRKTTDTQVPHHACSLVSPCCSRLHYGCASTSPCRVWGPGMCPHVRAGAAGCEDMHCKLVDWMKYNLCLPMVEERQVYKKVPVLDQRLMDANEALLRREEMGMVSAMA